MFPKIIPIVPDKFRNPLAPAAAVFYTLSALLGIAGLVLLFDSDYAAILVQDRIDGGVVLPSSLAIWYWIDTGITILSFLCPALLAVGLWLVLCRRYATGMKLISHLFQGLLWCVYTTSALALGCFLFGVVRNIIFYLGYNEGVYLVYGLLISEGLMGVQAFLLFLLIRKFLRESTDCACSIAYTLTAKKLDSMLIPSFPRLGLVILGCVQLVLSCNSIYTIVLVESFSQNYYKYTIAGHPGQYLAAVTLFTGAVGNFLLSFYLRRYNRICERTRFQASRIVSESP